MKGKTCWNYTIGYKLAEQNVRKIFFFHEWLISPFFAPNANILKQTKRSIWRMSRALYIATLPLRFSLPDEQLWIDVLISSENYSITVSHSPQHLIMRPRAVLKRGCFCFLCFFIFHEPRKFLFFPLLGFVCVCVNILMKNHYLLMKRFILEIFREEKKRNMNKRKAREVEAQQTSPEGHKNLFRRAQTRWKKRIPKITCFSKLIFVMVIWFFKYYPKAFSNFAIRLCTFYYNHVMPYNVRGCLTA